MQFNKEELNAVAQSAPNSFTKEGILFTRLTSKKNSKKLKNGEVYTERWFSLKGNLLFCMKGKDRTSGVSGVIVLERCSIELNDEEYGQLYSFAIGQNGGDDLINLACLSEAEREQWMASLHTASYECLRMQLDSLREAITKKTGKDPLTSPQSLVSVNNRLIAESETPFIEMCLACGLMYGSNDYQPNVVIDVLNLVPPNNTWQILGQTEVVEKSSSAVFMKTIVLGDHLTPLQTRIRLVVYDVKDVENETRSPIGQAIFILEELISSRMLTPNIIGPDGSCKGILKIMSWTTNDANPDAGAHSPREDNFPDSKIPYEPLLSRGSFSQCDWHEYKTYRSKKKEQLKSLFTSSICKMFRFPTVDNHQLSVCELMAESKITFTFPVVYMNFLLQETNQWRDHFSKLDPTTEDEKHKALLSNVNAFSEFLSKSVQNLEAKHFGQTFKPSQSKSDQVMSPVPINLHLHRMITMNEYTLQGASYDFITVGAFADHCAGFKNGGLHRLLKVYSVDGSVPKQYRLQMLVECRNDLAKYYEVISQTCDKIYWACKVKDQKALLEAYNDLLGARQQFKIFCDHDPFLTESVRNLGPNQVRKFARAPMDSSPTSLLDGLVSNVTHSLDQLQAQVQLCMSGSLDDWLEPVSTPKMKCDAFMEKYYSFCMLCITEAMMEESMNDPLTNNVPLLMRYTVVMSQALTAAVTGIIAKVRFLITDENFLRQISHIGCLLQFECLVSCYKSELGMLEDFFTAVQSLSNVDFKFVQGSSTDDYQIVSPNITGSRFKYCISLPLPIMAFQMLPESLQKGEVFHVVPLLFNVGINEQATIAERIGSTSMQDYCNKWSTEQLSKYHSQYCNLFNEASSPQNPAYFLKDLMLKLKQNVTESKKKNVEILQLSSEISRKLNGIRFTSCKSAKDRTSMSVTLEECNILLQEHELSPHVFNQALHCLRSEGVRRSNSFKNTGVMSYAFSSLQLLSFPKQYKPPNGTFGKGGG